MDFAHPPKPFGGRGDVPETVEAGAVATVPAVAGIKVASRWQRQQVSLKALSSQWLHQ